MPVNLKKETGKGREKSVSGIFKSRRKGKDQVWIHSNPISAPDTKTGNKNQKGVSNENIHKNEDRSYYVVLANKAA